MDNIEQLQEKFKFLRKTKEERKQELINFFENELQPFNGDIDKIPNIPIWDDNDYKQYIIPNLIRCGAIPKKDLIVGKTYIGNCRNATEAIWNGEKFTYKRYKFGTIYDEDINHFEDDDKSDLFVPIKEKE